MINYRDPYRAVGIYVQAGLEAVHIKLLKILIPFPVNMNGVCVDDVQLVILILQRY